MTWNRSHFKRFINRSETKGSQKLRKAGLITFYRLPEPMGLSRIKQAIDLIEAEANHVAKNKDTRLILVISKDWFRFER